MTIDPRARLWLPIIALLAFLPLAFLAGGEAPEARAPHAEEPTLALGEPVVVVELFTSQGCYSCPSADRLITELASSEAWGDRIIPLAFHVDYWNYIGWKDPFSSPVWSTRQERYAKRVFRTRRIYTPQAVIGGEIDCTGSDAACLRRALERQAAEPPSWTLTLSAAWSTSRSAAPGETGGGATAPSIEVQISALPRGAGSLGEPSAAPSATPRVLVALYENRLVTEVPRGENANKTLRNDFVVRHLAEAPSPEAVAAHPLRFSLEEGWSTQHLGIVAFLQDPESLRIVGAARLRPEELGDTG